MLRGHLNPLPERKAVTLARAGLRARNHFAATVAVLAACALTGFTAAAAGATPVVGVPGCDITAGTVSFDGEARVGTPIRAVPGADWNVTPGPATFAFTWFRGGVVVTDGASDTYTPALADGGAELSVAVTASSTVNAACSAPGTRIIATQAVKPAQFTPVAVSVSGTAQVGAKLKGTVGSFGPVTPTTVAYRWLRDGQAIAGATRLVYQLTGADAGHALSLRVTAKAAGYETLQVVSAATSAVAKGTFTKAKATIKGEARVGATLSATIGSLGVQKAALTYRWLRNGKSIKGATGRTYVVTSKDVGKKLSVRVTARREGFTTRSVTSSRTGRIPKLPKWVDPRCMTSGKVLCIDKNPSDSKLRYLVNGKVKMTLDARFGAMATPTREGVYAITYKSRDEYSTLYDSWMPYAMYFSGGQAVHYSSDFAARGYNGASHGCVNIRDKAGIAKLFSLIPVGTKVVVYH
jgi:hypothetical protein